MTGAADTILSGAIWCATLILAIAFLLTAWRVVRGPTLPDRVVALDMLVGIVIGFIALTALRTGFSLYVDIALALGLVGFLATIAFARFILPALPAKPETAAGAEPPSPVQAGRADAGKLKAGKPAAARSGKAPAEKPKAEKPKTEKTKAEQPKPEKPARKPSQKKQPQGEKP